MCFKGGLMVVDKTKMKKIVSSKVHRAYTQELDKIAREKDLSRSEVIKRAIIDFIARNEDLELEDATEELLERSDEYKEMYAEENYINMENKRISLSYKERTFLNFMDKQLAQVYYMNKDYYGEEQLENVLKNHLKAFSNRAEWHGLEGKYKQRLEQPIHYAKEFLDRATDAQSFEVDLT